MCSDTIFIEKTRKNPPSTQSKIAIGERIEREKVFSETENIL
jgi:hypothetical protein